MAKQSVYIATGTTFVGRQKMGAQERIYAAVVTARGRGMTANDVSAFLATDGHPDVVGMNVIQSTLSGLKRGGFVRRAGDKLKPVAPVVTDVSALEAEVLVKMEELLGAKAKVNGLSLDANESYALYAKVKPGYLGRRDSMTETDQNECAAFFRKIFVELAKSIL